MWRRRFRDRDVERELHAHLELEAAEQRENGLVPEDARYAARRLFGNPTFWKETTREMGSLTLLESFCQDLRYGWRTLRKNPSFAAAPVLSLALGIGGNAAIFSAVNTVLLKMLPVRDPQQLVLLRPIPYPAYELLRGRNGVFRSMLACANISMSGPAGPIDGQLVSGSYFETLGVDAAPGRSLTTADDISSAAPAAVISSATGSLTLARIRPPLGSFFRSMEFPSELWESPRGIFLDWTSAITPMFMYPSVWSRGLDPRATLCGRACTGG